MKRFIQKYGVYLGPLSLMLFFGFISFLLIHTCIYFGQIIELILFIMSFNFVVYYFLAKKFGWFTLSYINLAISTYFTPIVFAVVLGINYFTAKTVFKETVPVSTNVKRYGAEGLKVRYNNAPKEVCQKFFNIDELGHVSYWGFIETEIGKGILGLYVLKNQTYYTNQEYYLREQE